MELTAGRLACIVLVFLLGYYFGKQGRTVTVVHQDRDDDPADWWKRGEPPC